ncbi:SUMF1/EgtB/PvdO family nonheme iron enzyme [bacterium]|nr:SUMF1/EgtB/PvdO family nonheme iron enzyme [bacterium]
MINIFFIINILVFSDLNKIEIANNSKMVKIPNKNFKMDITEVTVDDFKNCVEIGICNKKNFDEFSSSTEGCNYGSSRIDHPMNCINFYGATEYCKWLGKRLPTKDEWKYALKGGENFKYAGSNNCDDVAWFYPSPIYKTPSLNSKWLRERPLKSLIPETHKVATKKANGYGLYDMNGNVSEWTNTLFDTYRLKEIAWINTKDNLNKEGFRIDDYVKCGGGPYRYNRNNVDTDFCIEESTNSNYMGNGFRCVQNLNEIEKQGLMYDLKISSNIDGVNVYINEKLIGETSTTTKLKEGIYKIKLVKNGFENFEKELNIFKDENLFVEMFKIEKDISEKMVKIPDRDFKMDITEVTNRDYKLCVNSGKCEEQHYNDGKCFIGGEIGWNIAIEFKGDKKPVLCITWEEAKNYCEWLGKRLPTEEEWEYAAKGGENFTFAGSNNPNEIAWYYENSGNITHNVGTKKANGYGLYDMSGNVWEWTDSLDMNEKNNIDSLMKKKEEENLFSLDSEALIRIIRGGCFFDFSDYERSNEWITYRIDSMPKVKSYDDVGFRCVQDLKWYEFKIY